MNRLPRIRPAAADDAEALARLGADTFTETFGRLYPPEDLADFLRTCHAPEVHRADVLDPALRVWVAEDDGGELVGWAKAGPCALPHPDVRPSCGEVKTLYVRRSAQGSGLGSRLLETALGWLEEAGPRELWIGVFSENYGAQRLYGRYGFEKAGEYEFPVGRVRDREFILRRRAEVVDKSSR